MKKKILNTIKWSMLFFIGTACWLVICEKKRQRVEQEEYLERQATIKRMVIESTSDENEVREREKLVEFNPIK